MASRPDRPAYRLVRPAPRSAPPLVLDDAQRAVVEHDRGALVVLAGPGTGKTATLVEAAARRVERGVPVDQLLLLTFGRRAATELRDRLTARLRRTTREPLARTLHSYAFGVLRMAAISDALSGDRDPSAVTPRLLSGAEQDLMIRELIEGDLAEGRSPWPAALEPALHTRGFAGELRDLLLRAVERGYDGAALAGLGRQQHRDDWAAAGRFLDEYQQVTALARPGAYDPAELIRVALDELRARPDLLAAERQRRRRIFVDEFQDTDPAQAELLTLIGAGSDEIVVVGDPDQSIYAFRGTDPSAMRGAADLFGAPQTVALTTSRRSGSSLLDASRRVAAKLPGPVAHRSLVPAAGLAPGTVEVRVLRSATEEASYLADVLRRAHLEDGIAWNRMAVIVRSTVTTLPLLRRAMLTSGVPISVRGDDLPLPEQPAVAHLVTALRCVLAGVVTEADAEQLLLGPIGRTDPLALRRLRREILRLARAGGADEPEPLVAALRDVRDLAALPARVVRPVERVAAALAAGAEALADSGGAEDVLWGIWQATGLAEQWAQSSYGGGPAGAAADRDLDSVIALFSAAARFADRLPHSSAGEFLAHLIAQQVPGDQLPARDREVDAVHLVTAHAAKGLEWDLVCIANVQEGSWPDLRPRGSLLGSETLVDIHSGRHVAGASTLTSQLAEERRLFYVAITRARRRLVVTAVSGQDEQPSRFLDDIDDLDGDRPVGAAPRSMHLPGLVAELRSTVCDPSSPLALRDAAAHNLARLAAAGVPGADPERWWGLAPVSDDGSPCDPDRPVRISPSSIEDFAACELRGVLKQVGAKDDDLISASLGTLIHDVAALADPDAGVDELERLVDERWAELDFGASWFSRNERERARGIIARLARWLADSRAQLELIAVERAFDVAEGDFELVGRVDRLERLVDGRLVVVDLKTGKSKPKTAELAEHPQLGAYQLAVELGGFDEGSAAGGARLVQLAAGGERDIEQPQPPLGDTDDPDWVRVKLDRMSERLRGGEFTAIVNDRCPMCPVAACCPLDESGRQVPR